MAALFELLYDCAWVVLNLVVAVVLLLLMSL